MRAKERFGRMTAVLALGLGLSLAAASAQAALITETIDFNNLAAGPVGNNLSVGTSGQFRYNGIVQGDQQAAVNLGGNIALVDGNINNASGSAGQLFRVGGTGLFSIVSIDIANLDGSPGGGGITPGGSGGLNGSGFRVGLTPSELSFVTNNSNFQTLDLSNVLSLDDINTLFVNIVSTSGLNFAIDNIVVQYEVPEPASLALLCAGLAGLGFGRRRPD